MTTSMKLTVLASLLSGGVAFADGQTGPGVPASGKFAALVEADLTDALDSVKNEIKEHSQKFTSGKGCGDIKLSAAQETQLDVAYEVYSQEKASLKVEASKAMSKYIDAVRDQKTALADASALGTSISDVGSKMIRAKMDFGNKVLFTILTYDQREAAVGCKVAVTKKFIKNTCAKITQQPAQPTLPTPVM